VHDPSHTQRLATIADPKLRQSNFVKFINRISNGEVVLQDGKAVEARPQQESGEAWAEEFEQQHQHPRPAAAESGDAWAADFERRVSAILSICGF
jgi:hypothetical protein